LQPGDERQHGRAIPNPGGLHFSAGAVLVLGAAACSVLYFTLQKPMIARYGALPCAAYALIAGTLRLTPGCRKRCRPLPPRLGKPGAA
jgi:drug/metabolite transporter (DMT)-like permease